MKEGVAEDVLGGLLAGLVEAVHVELPDEAVDVAVSEELGQDGLLELVDVPDGELFPVGGPLDDLREFVVLG